jgi:hypothetical protein
MNKAPPPPQPPDDVDDHYRRLSALDPGRPSETVRQSVLAYASRLAAQRTTAAVAARPPSRTGRRAAWRTVVFGTLATAALAGLMVAPRFLAPPAPTVTEHGAAQASRGGTPRAPEPAAPAGSAAAPAPATPAPAPRAQASPETQELYAAKERPVAATTGAAVSARAAASSRGLQSLPGPAAALRHAAEIGDMATLQTLLAEPLEINARDPRGRTALMLATLHGRTEAVAALLASGADPNATDARGVTPLQAAFAAQQPQIIALLQRAGAH